MSQSANPILEERCSYSTTPMANKDNNLKLNSSGKGNKKVSPRISPMTLGEFQITPKLSQGARKKGRKSDPNSVEKLTDKENSKKKATFVTVERPNSGASPELTSSSQSKNENINKKAALTTVEGPNPEGINEKSTDKENSKKKATFVTVERPNSETPIHELTSSSQSKNESPKKKATLITLERTNLEASGSYELTSGSETKTDTILMQDLAKMTPEKKLQFEKSDLWEQITSSIDTTKRMKRNDCITPIDKGQLISD